MGRKQVSRVIVGIGVLALTAAYAPAHAADQCRNRVKLTATSAGVAIDASGKTEARARRRGQQRFRVSIDAAVADGTTFVVYANGQPAGTITIVLGGGELDLNNNNGKTLPAGVDPVCAIGAVNVMDGAGEVILQGNLF